MSILEAAKRLPCFSVVNMQTKIKEGQHEHALHSHSYKRYKQSQGTPAAGSQEAVAFSMPLHGQQLGKHLQRHGQQQMRQMALRSSNGRLHQVHDAGRGPTQTQTLPGGYACRKHPNANSFGSNSNLYLQNDVDRRFYFEKPAASNCNLHSRSFAKSLNQLCVEPAVLAPDTSPADQRPLPPAAMFADLPQEFPLTRSVSTTTDIYTSAASPKTHMQHKHRRNMATNTQTQKLRDNYEEQAARLCGLKRGLRKTKDELFQEFCKRAGIRNKPKNIYYISSEEADDVPQSQLPQTSKRRRSQNGYHKNDDDDADGDEHGFQEFRSGPSLDDDHLFVVTDHAQLVHPHGMAASMYMDPMLPTLRKLNSNLSLHTQASNMWAWPEQRLTSEHNQSRTLPRSFMRQPAGSQDSLGSQLSSYSPGHQRISQLMQHQHQQQQHQLHPQNRYLSTLTLLHGEEAQIKAQPQPQAVQWPTAIPSSPSNYVNGYPHPQPLYTPAIAVPVSSSSNTSHPAKFQRAYAFDDAHRRGSLAIGEAFDLDEMERDRRRSHASLFGGTGVAQKREQYDLINGTAV
ncbi:GH11838 [Drosophila grimshawi]|uniref:GH11838 n=1 Tax=Drosophila grimshawi TaxID=7222 RepID=B4JIP1_DROGR|nr:GH11838 [Drosophila grimshawi]